MIRVSAISNAWGLIAPMLLLVALVLLSLLAPPDVQDATTTMIINVIIVVGLYIFAGNSGILSFGHMSFVAVGAYTTALLTMPRSAKELLLPNLPILLMQASIPTVPAIIVAGLVAGVVALVIGIPLVRLSGLPASLATFGWLIIVYVIISNWDSVTNGTSAIAGVPTDTTVFTAVLWAFGAMLLAYLFQHSSHGIKLRATREDLVAAQSIGISVPTERILSFVLSAFVLGAGGGVWAHLLGSFNPAAFYLSVTFITIAMLIIGGATSLGGAVVGTVVVSVVTLFLTDVENGVFEWGPLTSLLARPGLALVGLGLAFLLILILRPDGLTRGREFQWPFATSLLGSPSANRPPTPNHQIGAPYEPEDAGAPRNADV